MRLISQWPHGDDSHRHGGSALRHELSKDSQRLIHSDHMEMTAIDMEVRTLRVNVPPCRWLSSPCGHCEMTAIDMEVASQTELSKDSQRLITVITWRWQPSTWRSHCQTWGCLRTPSGSCHSDHMEMTAIDMEVRTLRHSRVSKDSQRLISQWPHGDDSHRHGGTHSQTWTGV